MPVEVSVQTSGSQFDAKKEKVLAAAGLRALTNISHRKFLKGLLFLHFFCIDKS